MSMFGDSMHQRLRVGGANSAETGGVYVADGDHDVSARDVPERAESQPQLRPRASLALGPAVHSR